MAFDELVQGLTLDSSGYVGGVDEATDAQEELDQSSGAVSDSLIDVDPAGVAAGAAIAGLGATITGVVQDTQDLRTSLNETAVDMDITGDEANALARDIADVTFPVEDATATMASLSDQGVETEEDMREIAGAADLIADATGTSAESVAENLGPAMRALGDDLEDMEEVADAVTLAVQNSTLETEDFAGVIERSSEELQEMNVDTEEAAGLIAAYAEETGKSGRQLRRDFSRAMREADGDMKAFMESTGLSEEQLAEFDEELAEGGNIAEEYAGAQNETITTMDRLQHGFDEARLAAGGMLGPVEAAGPALMGLGGTLSTVSAINFGMVIPSLTGVVAAAAPLLPLLIPLAAAVVGVGAAWRAGWIDPVETVTWLADRAGDALGWVADQVMWVADKVWEFYPPIIVARRVWEENLFGIQDTVGAVTGAIGAAIDWVVDKVNQIPGVNIGGDDVDVDEDAVEEAGEETAETFQSARDDELDEGAVDPGTVPDEPIDTNLDAQTGPSVPDDESDVDTDPPDRDRSPTTRGMDADDLAEAVREALDGVGLVLDGTIETDEGHIVEITEGVLDHQIDKQTRGVGR